ncbi:hypothetical protein X732_16540 [Mesorhizobium sp. L2C066B000]|nr:hypothetical protein X732_16540 [Mesorhizobium sp. L2C066B000]
MKASTDGFINSLTTVAGSTSPTRPVAAAASGIASPFPVTGELSRTAPYVYRSAG